MQTALCYLKAVRPKVSENLRDEKEKILGKGVIKMRERYMEKMNGIGLWRDRRVRTVHEI